MNEFNVYPLFNDVKNPTLRTWNRLNIIYNMKKLVGNAVSQKYTGKFKHDDLARIMKLSKHIETNGYEQTRRDIMKGLMIV